MKIIKLYMVFISIFLTALVLLGQEFPTSRDPYKWPFRQNSIWNMPIGSNAKYEHSGIHGGTGYFYSDPDIIILTPDAPLTNVELNTKDWTDHSPGARCSDMGATLARLPIPTDLVIPHEGGIPNTPCAILEPDGRTIHQSQPFHRCEAGSYAVSHYIYPSDDIMTGDGIQGAHGGSGMSSLGGAVDFKFPNFFPITPSMYRRYDRIFRATRSIPCVGYAPDALGSCNMPALSI